MARADAARERLESWLAGREDVAGAVLTTPGSVAWATGPAGTGPAGAGSPVTEAASTDPHTTGPHTTGPHTTGPHTTGPQITGPGWPAEDDELVPPRPAVLEVA